jgi:putative salt-induced outer membrane protein YdiY
VALRSFDLDGNGSVRVAAGGRSRALDRSDDTRSDGRNLRMRPMDRYVPALALSLLFVFGFCFSETSNAQTPAANTPSTPVFDEVRLKDGSVIVGTIVKMGVGAAGQELELKTAFGIDETIKIKWAEVESIRTNNVHEFALADGSKQHGRIVRTENGSAIISTESATNEIAVPLGNIVGTNLPTGPTGPQLQGNISLGVQIADGNTQTKAASFLTEAVFDAKPLRLTGRAAWNYSSDSRTGLTARNTRGSLKADYFITERFFVFASALLEEDRFQDLSLRTALAAGPGYQLVKRGELTDPLVAGLEAYGEIGLAFFNEDFRTGVDQRYLAARWAIKVDWEITEGVTLFHNHEGYPGLEDISDLYILTEQGIRLKIFQNFIATLQVNWRWDNTPSPGFQRSDTLYLATLGWQFSM